MVLPPDHRRGDVRDPGADRPGVPRPVRDQEGRGRRRPSRQGRGSASSPSKSAASPAPAEQSPGRQLRSPVGSRSHGDIIDIVLPDGSTATGPRGHDGGRSRRVDRPEVGPGDAVIAVVDGVERDLGWPLADGDQVAIVIARRPTAGRYILRHSTAHVLAQAVLELFPGAKFSIGPPIEDGFYYDFDLPDGRTFTPRTTSSHRGADARDHRGPAAVRPRRDPRSRSPRSCSPTSRTSARSSTGKADAIRRSGDRRRASYASTTTRPSSSTCAAARTCRTPAGSGHFKLMRVAGAYWRGDEKQPDAAAHLRHGVGVRAGSGRAPASAGGGREARPPTPRGRARPVQLPDRARRRPRRVPPEGRPGPQADGGLLPRRATSAAGYEFVVHAAHREGRRCSRRRATSTGTPTACIPPMELDGGPPTTSSR